MIPFRPIPVIPKRKQPSLTVKLAACLARMTGPDGGPLVPGAATMTAKQICTSVQFHHEQIRELLGSDHPTNLIPQPRDYHIKVQTPKDAHTIARSRHARKAEVKHRAIVEAKPAGEDLALRDAKWRRRPWPKRPMQGGRQFQKRRTGEPVGGRR